MKHFTVAKICGAAVLALSLSTLPAVAQTGSTSGDATTGSTSTYSNRDDGFDWGWLGLLGLVGLAGLAGKNKRSVDETTRYRDPNEVGSSSNRY